jgi:OOP family OmpA-OmpF porin
MKTLSKAVSLAVAAGVIGFTAPALSEDCVQQPQGPYMAPQWNAPAMAMPPQPQFQAPPRPEYQMPMRPQFQAPPRPEFQMPPQPQFQAPPRPEYRMPPQPQFQAPPRPEFQMPPQPQFQAPPRPEFQMPPQPQFQAPPRPEYAPPAEGYGYQQPGYGPAPYPYYDGDNSDWNNDWGNDWFGNWDGLFDGTGHLDFDFEMDMKMDFDAEADADSDYEYRGDSNYEGSNYGYQGYGPYGPYAPYPYPPAPMMAPPAPAPQPAPAPAPAPVEEAPAVSVDDDQDGVINPGDFCPGTAAGTQVDAFGCAIDESIVLRGVNFHTNSDQLTDESIAILNGVANTLVAHQELRLEVSGHTDSDGDDAYNKDLSQRRAEQVRKYLGDKGAKVENLTAKGYGEEKPIAGNDTAEGKAQNRRVELNRL